MAAAVAPLPQVPGLDVEELLGGVLALENPRSTNQAFACTLVPRAELLPGLKPADLAGVTDASRITPGKWPKLSFECGPFSIAGAADEKRAGPGAGFGEATPLSGYNHQFLFTAADVAALAPQWAKHFGGTGAGAKDRAQRQIDFLHDAFTRHYEEKRVRHPAFKRDLKDKVLNREAKSLRDAGKPVDTAAIAERALEPFLAAIEDHEQHQIPGNQPPDTSGKFGVSDLILRASHKAFGWDDRSKEPAACAAAKAAYVATCARAGTPPHAKMLQALGEGLVPKRVPVLVFRGRDWQQLPTPDDPCVSQLHAGDIVMPTLTYHMYHATKPGGGFLVSEIKLLQKAPARGALRVRAETRLPHADLPVFDDKELAGDAGRDEPVDPDPAPGPDVAGLAPHVTAPPPFVIPPGIAYAPQAPLFAAAIAPEADAPKRHAAEHDSPAPRKKARNGAELI